MISVILLYVCIYTATIYLKTLVLKIIWYLDKVCLEVFETHLNH